MKVIEYACLMVAYLLLVSVVMAGPNNPGPHETTAITWADQTITTAGITSSNFYSVGRDTQISAAIHLGQFDDTKIVTLRALFENPGGNPCGYPLDADTPQEKVITGGTDPIDSYWDITPQRGASRMYIHGQTSDTDGCSPTVEVIGF